MSKKLVPTVFCLGLLALNTAAAYAQGSPEVIVRQGDTIEWFVASPPPHKVRFGGGGATSVADINLLLDIDPATPLTPGSAGEADSRQASTGKLLGAKVKDDAAPGTTFVFNCGVHSGGQMLSLPFTIAAKMADEPARTYRIMGEPGPHWHLHVDTTP